MSSVNSKKKLNSIADNDDILTEILVRLPLKSILRCKSVSRQWRSLISGPHFCRRIYPDPYLVSGLLLLEIFHNNPEYNFVPLTEKPTSPPFKTLTLVNHPLGLRILQSCHGLLFCSSFTNRGFGHDYYIYNPTTKQFRTIPLPPGGQDSTMVHGMTLAYDPHKSPHYKVVCVRKPNSWQAYLGIYSQPDYLNPFNYDHHRYCGRMGYYSRYQILIYSSETRSWKLSGRPFIAHNDVDFRRGVFWNGAVHWVNYHSSPSLYFKVDDEKLRKMPMPATPIPNVGIRLLYLEESRAHLHLVDIYGMPKFDVYEMKTDYSGWFVKYQVDLDSITNAFPEMISTDFHPSDFAILGIIREADDAESYMVFHKPGKVFNNLNDRTFNMIRDFSPGSEEIGLRFRWFDAYHYIETIASI